MVVFYNCRRMHSENYGIIELADGWQVSIARVKPNMTPKRRFLRLKGAIAFFRIATCTLFSSQAVLADR